MSKHRAELTTEDAARFGALLAGKGLTPEQAAAVVRDQVQPVLDEAMQLVEHGADPNTIEFGLQRPGQS